MIDKSDRLALAQTPHKAGYDPNRIVQQLTICRITDVTFHTGRIHSDLAPLFQTFLIGQLTNTRLIFCQVESSILEMFS